MFRRITRRLGERRLAKAAAEYERQLSLTRATYDALLEADGRLAAAVSVRLDDRIDAAVAEPDEFLCLIRHDEPKDGAPGWKPGWVAVTDDKVLWTCVGDPDVHEGLRYQAEADKDGDGDYYFDDVLEDPDAAGSDDWWDDIMFHDGRGATAVAANRHRRFAAPTKITFARLRRDDWPNELIVRTEHDTHQDLIGLL